MSGELNERTRRLVAVSEAMGWGGISAVSRATRISRKAISHGIKELQERRGTIIMENAQEFIERKEVEFQHDRVRTMKDGAGNAYVWNREAWTLMMQSDYPKKVFVVERFRRDGDVQYRFSFYGAK